jgi:hypothetical protein
LGTRVLLSLSNSPEQTERHELIRAEDFLKPHHIYYYIPFESEEYYYKVKDGSNLRRYLNSFIGKVKKYG